MSIVSTSLLSFPSQCPSYLLHFSHFIVNVHRIYFTSLISSRFPSPLTFYFWHFLITFHHIYFISTISSPLSIISTFNSAHHIFFTSVIFWSLTVTFWSHSITSSSVTPRPSLSPLFTVKLLSIYMVKTVNNLTVAYNNSLRNLLGIPGYCSASEMFAHRTMPSVSCVIRKSKYTFMKRLKKINNHVVYSVVNREMTFASLQPKE